MRPGIEVLDDVPGTGPLVERQRVYRIRLRMWLSRGDAVKWRSPWGSIGRAVLEDDNQTLVTDVRLNRVFLVSGLFYGVQGMRVGGTRTLKISPHMAYRDRGLPAVIPPNAVLRAEVSILEERATPPRRNVG